MRIIGYMVYTCHVQGVCSDSGYVRHYIHHQKIHAHIQSLLLVHYTHSNQKERIHTRHHGLAASWFEDAHNKLNKKISVGKICCCWNCDLSIYIYIFIFLRKGGEGSECMKLWLASHAIPNLQYLNHTHCHLSDLLPCFYIQAQHGSCVL